MFRNLGPGAIGVDRNALDIFTAAREAGFEGLDPDMGQVAELGPTAFLRPYEQHGLKVGGWGLPVPLQAGDEQYRAALDRLGAHGRGRCFGGRNALRHLDSFLLR